MIAPAEGKSTRQGQILTDQQRLEWLRLWRSENIGPATFRDLLNFAGSAAAALEELPELSRKAGVLRPLRLCDESDAAREIDALAAAGGRFIGLGEPDYPPLLREIDGPPPLIAVRGNSEVFFTQSLAIIGSRNASVAGRKLATSFAHSLSEQNIIIVSGLARGIDASAHTASLEGGTIAVMAGGLDRIYPAENQTLADDILDQGGLHVAEMPLGWQPRAQDFPRRNRLVSGLSCAVLVIEAASRSGTLITARFAGEQGRDVFAIPNSPLDPRGAGTNRLLKQGAVLVTDPQEIVELLASQDQLARTPPVTWQEPEFEQKPAPPRSTDRQVVLDCLSVTPVHIDDILRFSGCHPAHVYQTLIELDLAGRLIRHADGQLSLGYSEELL